MSAFERVGEGRSWGERGRTQAPPGFELQGLIGNRGMTRLLQRFAVVGEEEETDQSHHPKYRFKFGAEGQQELYDLDKYITSKVEPPAKAFLAGRDAVRSTVLDAVKAWDTSKSIVDVLTDALIANTGGTIANWKAAEVRDELVTSEAGKTMVKYLLSLKANMKLRTDDIDKNARPRVTIWSKKKVGKDPGSQKDWDINWKSVVKDARELLKENFKADQPKPVPKDKDDVRLIDQAVKASNDPGLAELRKVNALVEEDGAIRFKAKSQSGSTNADRKNHESWITDQTPINGKPPQFNFGLNHLRFMLYLEWRLLTELLL